MATISSPALTATICNLEHRAWRALCTSGAALLPLLSHNPVVIFPGNLLLTATSSPSIPEILASETFKPWTKYTLSHDEVVPLGSEAAMVYYRVEAEREGAVFRAICSSCWVREGADEGVPAGGLGRGEGGLGRVRAKVEGWEEIEREFGVKEGETGFGWRMASHQQTLI